MPMDIDDWRRRHSDEEPAVLREMKPESEWTDDEAAQVQAYLQPFQPFWAQLSQSIRAYLERLEDARLTGQVGPRATLEDLVSEAERKDTCQ